MTPACLHPSVLSSGRLAGSNPAGAGFDSSTGRMTFWDEHETSEAVIQEREVKAHRRDGRQNVEADCVECGHRGEDVMFGSCRGCFDGWHATRGTP